MSFPRFRVSTLMWTVLACALLARCGATLPIGFRRLHPYLVAEGSPRAERPFFFKSWKICLTDGRLVAWNGIRIRKYVAVPLEYPGFGMATLLVVGGVWAMARRRQRSPHSIRGSQTRRPPP
jgi:hypothetical protein